MKKIEMLIRKSEENDPEKYYVCYATDGSPVSNTTDYQYFDTIKTAKKYIAKNNGKFITE